MEVKILILTLSFVQSVVLQVIESSTSDEVVNTNNPFNTPFRRPNQSYLNRPLSLDYADQNNNRQNWIASFPDRFPFYNNRLKNRPMPFNIGIRRPFHSHMINIPSQSQLGTSILEGYLNRHNTTPHRFGTLTKPNTNGNHMNRPIHIWYRPHGTGSSVGLLNRPSNKPCHSQAPETSVLVSNPSGPTISDQAVNAMNHEHHDNTNNSNSNPPKEIQEDPTSDDSSPEIDIRGGFDG